MLYKYLVKVDSIHNMNKFYEIRQKGKDVIITYERINGSKRTICKDKDYAVKKYEQKLKKGYQDVTQLLEESDVEEKDDFGIDELVREVLHFLKQCTNASVQKSYMNTAAVTVSMIRKANSLINELYNLCDIERFNKKLEEVFMIIPRKMSDVSLYISHSEDDFYKIIERERQLLENLESKKKTDTSTDIFKDLGIEIYPASEEQIKDVERHLRGFPYKRIYRVINKDIQNKFNDYLKNNGSPKVKMFWHGSVNENWLSIITNGLKIREKASNGRMYGNGIYFAESPHKSLGYTSSIGSKWAKGKEKRYFMALFACAYGNPLNIDSWDSSFYFLDYGSLKEKGDYHCLHAYRGHYLKADEIIFYKDSQVTVSYLVEF